MIVTINQPSSTPKPELYYTPAAAAAVLSELLTLLGDLHRATAERPPKRTNPTAARLVPFRCKPPTVGGMRRSKRGDRYTEVRKL